MTIIIGIVLVLASVVAGYLMAGGALGVLLQIPEFVTIIGVTVGGMMIAAPMSVLQKAVKYIPKAMTHKPYSKDDYMALLKSFYDLFVLAQRNGLLSLEKHVENPAQSDVLGKNAKFLSNTIAVSFVADTLKVMLSGGVPPHEIEELMDIEIETFEAENKPVPAIINKAADSLPGIGIVAAVLGIIITMGSITDGPEVVGHHVAAALVGTFVGVLLSYGIFGPLATAVEGLLHEEAHLLQSMKTCIVAYAKGNPPIVAVEIARRTIYNDKRPTFSELEQYLRGK